MANFYTLARTILPQSLQAQLGNRNKIKRKTLDPLLFDFTSHPREKRLHFEKAETRNVPRARLEDNPFIPAPVAQSFRYWYSAEQIEQIVQVQGPVLIEPTTGWPMGPRNELYLSLYPSGKSPYLPVPPYKTIAQKSPIVHLPKVVSLRNANENGYSHFYTDLLTKLALARAHGVSLKDYTLVIAKNIASRSYAQFLLNTPLVKECGPIYLQDNEFISCDEALFINVFGNPTNSPAFLNVVKQVQDTHPQTAPVGNRKIFLTRGTHRRRTMQNTAEIGAILAAKGFETVDADTLTLPQQMECFANCRYLVGIHGAGLVNMLYRYPHKLSLFEICEPLQADNYGLNAQYHNLTVALGYDYGATIGTIANQQNHSFYMPADRFEADFNAFWAEKGN